LVFIAALLRFIYFSSGKYILLLFLTKGALKFGLPVQGMHQIIDVSPLRAVICQSIVDICCTFYSRFIPVLSSFAAFHKFFY